MKVNFECSTNGSGLWSRVSKAVQCVELNVDAITTDGENEFGELRVYFDVKTWNVRKDGLIYTDKQFIEELRAALNDLGFSPEAVDDVHYSEQGMQGADYVSFDVCEVFLPEYRRVSRESTPAYTELPGGYIGTVAHEFDCTVRELNEEPR